MSTDNEADRLSALIDGALSPAEAQELEENPEMADHIARMRRNDDLLRAVVPLDDSLPEGLLERLGLAEPEAPSNVVSMADARSRIAAQAKQARPVRFAQWKSFAAMAAMLTLVVIGANWASAPLPSDPAASDAPYRTLSSAAQPGQAKPNALVIFAEGTSRAQVSAIVNRAGGQIVGDRTSAGAWKLAISPQQRDVVLGRLRRAPGVTLAEPLDGDTP